MISQFHSEQTEAVLAINPGTTTTRCGLYRIKNGAVSCVTDTTLDHDEDAIADFPDIPSQLDFRAKAIERILVDKPGNLRIAAFAGRGGMLTPVPGLPTC